MNEKQANNTLNWVEALLSGKYKHGQYKLYDPNTDCWCVLGVALEINDIPITNWAPRAMTPEQRTAWLHEHFGLRQDPIVYTSINDHSKNFLAVVVLLLDAVPNHTLEIRRRKALLNGNLQLQMKAEHSRGN